MKHYLITILLTMLCSVNLLSKSLFNVPARDEPEKIDITIENNENKNEDERSIYRFIIEPYIDKSQSVVHVELYNIGTAFVIIKDSYGQIVCNSSADTAIPITLHMPIASGDNLYFIEIISTRYYASGFFNL